MELKFLFSYQQNETKGDYCKNKGKNVTNGLKIEREKGRRAETERKRVKRSEPLKVGELVMAIIKIK